MNGYEDARFDLSEAHESINTALELLQGMHQDGEAKDPTVNELISSLITIRTDLEGSYARLVDIVDAMNVNTA